MAIIKSQIDTNSKDFAANETHMRELVEGFSQLRDNVQPLMGYSPNAVSEQYKKRLENPISFLSSEG